MMTMDYKNAVTYTINPLYIKIPINYLTNKTASLRTDLKASLNIAAPFLLQVCTTSLHKLNRVRRCGSLAIMQHINIY